MQSHDYVRLKVKYLIILSNMSAIEKSKKYRIKANIILNKRVRSSSYRRYFKRSRLENLYRAKSLFYYLSANLPIGYPLPKNFGKG